MSNYIIYHLHTMLSNPVTNIDSVNDYKQYIDRAKELDMKAIAFSEHGNVFEWLHKKEYCEKNGLKYIHAAEVYVTKNFEAKERDNYHVVLMAKNYDGFKELNTLVSKSFNRSNVKVIDDVERFYYQPRISFDELINTSDNIIITTACIAGILQDENDIYYPFLEFLKNNKHRCFLEIQHHNVDVQKKHNQKLYELSKEFDVKLIAGTDTHCLSDEYVDGRSVLQKAKNTYFDNEEGWDLTFKSYEELVECYKFQNTIPEHVYLEAIDNTNLLLDMIEDFQLDRSYKYPKFSDNPKEDVYKITNEGIEKKNESLTKDLKERIDYEINTYEHNGALDLLLLEDDVKRWARKNNIAYGDSRGSVSGSQVAYYMQITNVNSIKHNLNYERFMNKERVSLADIVTDWSPSQRDLIKQYLHSNDKYYTAEIVTFNTIADKGAIRDVGRALEIPLSEVDDITKGLETNEDDLRKQYPKLFKYVDLLKGVVVSMGSHPAATICSPITLHDNVGTITLSTNNYPVSCLNMKEIDSLNFVKLDVLGLDNVEIIAKTCELAGIERLTSDNVDDEDENVWKDIMKSPLAIFQFESNFAHSYLKKVFRPEIIQKIKEKNPSVKYIDLMSMANGAIRPAGESYREALANGEFNDNGHEALNNMLNTTNGFLVYQEQIIEFLNKFCGFSMGQADVVRRCVEENTLITMGNGNVKHIKDVNIGDIVMSVNKYGVTEPKRVTNVFNNGEKKVYKIITMHNYELLATGNHKVYTQDGYKKIKDITKNDMIMSVKNINASKDNLRPNQRLSCEEMFLLGMLICDGTIYALDNNGKENNRPSFTNSDIKLIEKFQQCILSRIRERNGKRSTCEFYINSQKGVNVDDIYNIRIKTDVFNNSLIKLLDKYYLRHHAKNKKLNDALMYYPKGNKLQSLLGGLFSTDGGCYRNYIDYSTTSELLAYQIKNLLLKFNIYSYVDKKYVENYNYYSFRVNITQPKSLYNFDKYILPYVVGGKQNKYKLIINNALSNDKKFNYLMPNKCKEEIKNNMQIFNKSFNDVGNTLGYNTNCYNIHNTEEYITDIKAKEACTEVYAPYTYWLLNSEYIPLYIKSIECVGIKNVYDIEVEDNHNYIANGLCVHNCFAKKYGTEEQLPKIKEGFIYTMKKEYGVEESKAQQIIESFLKVIEDASDYLFSYNHALPYSYIGYICGWLRYYYPLEFLSVVLNINENNQEKTASVFEYIRDFTKIKVRPINFRYSKDIYMIDKKTNAIYKGIKSIKFCNQTIADELYSLRNNQYNNFVELLYDISTKTSVNARQLDILIKLDYFREFGNSRILNGVAEYFDILKQGKAKQISIDKVKDNEVFNDIIKRYSRLSPSGKTYMDINVKPILENIEEWMKCNDVKDYNIKQKISFQKEYLGYIDLTTEKDEDRRKLLILEVNSLISKKTNKPWAYAVETISIGSGKKSRLTIWAGKYDKKPLIENDIVYATKVEKNNKGYWYLLEYDVINEEFN